MAILNRVAKIIKSQIRARIFSGRGMDEDSGAPEKRQTRSAQNSPAEDPELAGYYANLELNYGADLAEVTRAWKNLLKRYHPDLHSGDADKEKIATEIVKQLNTAYHKLKKHLEHKQI